MRVITKIIPVFNKIVTTCDKVKFEKNKSGIIITSDIGAAAGEIDQVQTILSVGPMAEKSNFKPGQKILINPARYAKIKHTTINVDGNKLGDNLDRDFEYPTFQIKDKDGKIKDVLLLADNDIHCIIECDEYSGTLSDLQGTPFKL